MVQINISDGNPVISFCVLLSTYYSMHLRINIVACLQCNLTDCMRLVSARPYNEEHKFTRTYEQKKVSLHRLRFLPDFGQIKLID